MITKNSTVKELLQESIIKWFSNTILERTNAIKNSFLSGPNKEMMMQMGASESEINHIIDEILDETKYLKTINDIKTYCSSNKLNSEINVFDPNSSFMQMMTSMLESGQSIAKVLVNLQMKKTLLTIDEVVTSLKDVENKLGADEILENVELDDLSYLFKKMIENKITPISNFINLNANDRDNIYPEFEQLKNSNSLEIKNNSIEIIDKYLTEFKSKDILSNIDIQNVAEIENKEDIVIYTQALEASQKIKLELKLFLLIINNFENIEK